MQPDHANHTHRSRGENILAIDSGTQSVRALVFDPQGHLVAQSKVEQEPYRSPKPGWAEQDPDYYYSQLCRACQSLWDQIHKESIAAVSVTTQRNTVICLDEQDQPLRPAIVWLDQRRTNHRFPVGPLWRTAFALARVSDTIAYFQAESEANWIATNQPDIWRKTKKFVFLSGFLLHRLTGQYVDSVGSQVGYVPFDYKRLQWAKRSDWKWRVVPVTKDMLPELVQPGTVAGSISKAATKQTGIPEGLPVVAAAADKACEVLGSGCLDAHQACLSYGTTATINTTHRNYLEVIPFIPPYPSALPGAYSLEVQIYRGYWLVSWFKKQFGQREQKIADEKGIAPEKLFDEMIRDVPPGSMGLILQPFWTPGVRVPGPEAKGAIIGFGDVHTRAHIYRAILEGLAYGLREGLQRSERRTKTPILSLRVAGGGSQSDQAMQITADIFGIPAGRPHVYEASGLGAAIDAAVGAELHSDFASAVSSMTRTKDVFEPRPDVHRVYDDLYRRVYLKLYRRLKPLYEEIQAITGYPAPLP